MFCDKLQNDISKDGRRFSAVVERRQSSNSQLSRLAPRLQQLLRELASRLNSQNTFQHVHSILLLHTSSHQAQLPFIPSLFRDLFFFLFRNYSFLVKMNKNEKSNTRVSARFIFDSGNEQSSGHSEMIRLRSLESRETSNPL